jgi:hypothetical protein
MHTTSLAATTQSHSKRRISPTRRGNLLVGCGVVLLIFVILLAIGGYIVATSWRGWTASTSTKMIDTMLTSAQIDPEEHAEIMVHVTTLMERFENKDITLEQLGQVIEQFAKSPVIPSAMVISIDRLYIAQSDLTDEEKSQARIDLARYTQGLFDESIEPNSLNDVLEPVVTHTPDDNDIRLNLKIDENGRTVTALRSADEVSTEELQLLISTAKGLADEAGITEIPQEVDLSDEIQRAIGIALNEIAIDEEVEIESDDLLEDEPTDTPDTPDTQPDVDDGP